MRNAGGNQKTARKFPGRDRTVSNKTQNPVRVARRHLVNRGMVVTSRQKVGALSSRDEKRDALL
jgi:hypothetical protein